MNSHSLTLTITFANPYVRAIRFDEPIIGLWFETVLVTEWRSVITNEWLSATKVNQC